MTTEKIYYNILEMVKAYAKANGDDSHVISDPAFWVGSPGGFYGHAAEILADCLEKMDKKTSGAGRLSVCKRMVKECNVATISGIHETGGRYCICDGYRLFRFSADISSIPRAAAPFDFDATVGDLGPIGDTLPAVSRADIKAFIAENGLKRSKLKKAYTPSGWPEWYAVNPFFLLDILDAIPDVVFYKPGKYSTPLYFKSTEGDDGILCPIGGEKYKSAWLAHVKRMSEKRGA